jgi:hypothetical protein
MRIRKLMYDSFYVNEQAFSGVTSVDNLTTDLYFHFTDLDDTRWKLSGNTDALASGLILEDSNTTAITVTPSSITGSTAETQQLSVVNQDGVNVLSECAFSATTAKSTVSSGGLITFVTTGTTSVKVTHPDIPLTPTTVPNYIYWSGSLSIEGYNTTGGTFSGYTGTTMNATATVDGHDVTTVATWNSSETSVGTVGLHTGVLTLLTTGYTYITATYPPSGYAGRALDVYV